MPATFDKETQAGLGESSGGSTSLADIEQGRTDNLGGSTLTPDQQSRAEELVAAGLDPNDYGIPWDEKTVSEEFSAGQFTTLELIENVVLRDLLSNAEALGYTEEAVAAWYEQNKQGLMEYIDGEVIPAMIEATGVVWDGSGGPMQFEVLTKFARNYLTGVDESGTIHKLFNPNLAGANTNRRTVGGGGGGTGALTPEQIRAQFDLDQLSNMALDQYRGLLFDEPKNARAIAKAYVDMIVSNPDQKVDYATFVREQVKREPRYAALYRNKPQGMTEEQYFQPYVQAATQFLRPNEVGDAAAGAAQLGSSQQTFRERMGRTESTTGSSPFIQSFEKRLEDVRGVFKG